MENIEDGLSKMAISGKTEENEVTPSLLAVKKEDEQTVFKNFYLYVCHYNCRSLKGPKKLKEMDSALSEIKCDVIGLAETRRSTSDPATMESGRTLFNSPSEAGLHGVGFFVAAHLAATAVFKVYSPRLASLQLPGHRLHLVEAYAPTLSKSDDIYDRFMNQVSEACRRRPPGYRLILLGDFNARVEQNDTNMDIVGDFTYGDGNKRGVVVVEICRELEIRLLNTFAKTPTPGRWTHQRTRGRCKAQIDYIATNISDQDCNLSVLCMDVFEYHSDHRLLQLKTRKVTDEVTAHSSTEKKTDRHKDILEECAREANIKNLHILKMIIEKSVEYHTGLCLAFVDIRKVFSAADWNAVKKNLQQQKLLDKTETEACQGDFYTSLSAAVIKLLEKAVNSEDICGVVLTYKGLDKSFKLLTSGHNCIFLAPSIDKMTSMLQNTFECLSFVGMDLNVENMVFMAKTIPGDVHFGDKILKFVQSIVYLGCRISIPFNHDKEVERRISLGHAAFYRLQHFLCNSQLAMEERREQFEVSVSSVTLYGSETWVLTAAAKRMLQACQRRLESKMLGITELDQWPEEKMSQATGIKNWLHSAVRKKKEWDEKITPKSLLYLCTHGSPQNGRMSGRTPSSPADSQPKHSRHSTGDVDYSMRKMMITGKEEKEVTVAPCQPPALRDGQQVVTSFSNIYKLTVKQETIVWRYNVAVSAEMNNRVIRLSAGARDNAIHRKEVCQTIMSVGLKTVLSKNEFHIYDGAKCLFVNADIYDRITQRSNVIYLSEAQLPPVVKKLLDMVDLKEIRIEINIPMEGDSSFDLGQFCKARQADDLSNLDRTPLQCLELLTTSPAISSGAFTAIGDRKLFLKNVPGKDVGRGQEERLGLVKGIRILETQKEQPIAAMTVDARTALFFKPQPLIQTVRELMGWRPEDDHYPFDFESDDWAKINDYIGGLRVTLSYGSMKYNFITSGISKIPLKDITFEYHQTGNRVHAIDNYKNVLPHWPAVIMKKRVTDKTGEQKEILLHFPLDLLQIAANQMVPPYKQSEQKPIPMHIETRFSKINSMLHKIYGGVDAQILDAFGVHISESPMTATAIRRSLPNVVFRGDQAVIFNSSSSSWRMERNLKYVAAAKLNDVVVAYDTFKREDVQSVENMKNKLATLAKQQGLTARWHVFSTSNGSTHQKIVNLFEYVKAEKVNGNLGPLVLIIYVDSISNTESHNILKLYEIQHQIPTQQITMEVAKTVPSRGITACNILHKINAKMGGLNYKVIPDKFSRDSWISNKESLVIGYDVSHPTGSSGEVLGYKKPPTLPSIIGMSFNGAEHPENFIGDFHYQEPRKEQVTSSILTDRVQWMLNLFTKHRKLPENIIILRDGVSDGQFKMVVDEEFEAIKRGIDIYKQKNNVKNWTPKFVVAIVTKRHNNRFASLNEKGLVNHVPGTVIDKELVRSDITHFFMLSHNVLKGTGKLPSYYIPINELKTADTESQDRLQSMFLGLSFLHQVSQNSVSLPEPVYQADEWAKRGKNLWTAYCNTSQRLPRLSNWNKELYSSAPLDFEEMSKRLCYQNTALEQFRTNA